MGGKISKPQFQRNKSLSSLGRSSQRNLFQKSKLKLNQIQKKLDEANHDEIKSELEGIEQELNHLATIVKDKNKNRYEEIVKQFQSTKQTFLEKFKPQVQEAPKVSEAVVAYNTKADQVVEIRKPEVVTPVIKPDSPRIKFGIQVMPITPRISQEMLRNTMPYSESAKAEFTEIRSVSLNSDQGVGYAKAIIHTSISEENGKVEFSKVSALNPVEKLGLDTDELENALKYFHGVKDDAEYEELHYKLVQTLIKLDNIEVNDNPVIKQEKKILIQRIQDLLRILERLSAPITEIDNENQRNVDALIGTPI